MIAELREMNAIRSDRVADASRIVPRHLFAPDEPLVRAYAANSTVVTKRDEHAAAPPRHPHDPRHRPSDGSGTAPPG